MDARNNDFGRHPSPRLDGGLSNFAKASLDAAGGRPPYAKTSYIVLIAHGVVLEYDNHAMRYSAKRILEIQSLRKEGKTYGEIRQHTGSQIPKSTLSYMCRKIQLPKEYDKRIKKLNIKAFENGRRIAVEMNKIKREEFFQLLISKNTSLANKTESVDVGKIALAMLCLGEASKYNPKKPRSFNIGNSDSRIIIIFLRLLRQCFPFTMEKIRASVQCRADQNTVALEKYWRNVTGIPKRLFYKPLIDPRTIGKPTLKKNYYGVLRIYYFDTKIQLELECLADLIYNTLL